MDPLYLAFGDLKSELAVTREMLSRIPNGCFDWRPHDKSWNMGELASHIVDLLWWQMITLKEDGIDMSQPWPKTNATTQEELMIAFDTNQAKLVEALKTTTIGTLEEPWTLSYGDQHYFTESKATVLRRYGISHLIHHRAQLTIYLRMNDLPLPPSYGPTADE